MLPGSGTVSDGQSIYLRLQPRLDTGRMSGGSAGAMRLFISGVPVQANRLVNKPSLYPHGRVKIAWFDPDAANCCRKTRFSATR